MPTNKYSQPHIRIEIVLPITQGQKNPHVQSLNLEDLQSVLKALTDK